MAAILDSPITAQDWQREAHNVNGARSETLRRRLAEDPASRADEWKPILERLTAIEQLADDWDGLGARAPSADVLTSAYVLVHFWIERRQPAPTRVVASTAGAVVFEWQGSDGSFLEFEVDRPVHAEIMLKLPGQPIQHLEWPTN